MIHSEIKITPEYWKQPYQMHYTYASPQGTMWNVSGIIPSIKSEMVHVWTVNAWGQVFREAIELEEFISKWTEAESHDENGFAVHRKA